MNYIFQKVKTFYFENTKTVHKYAQYGIFIFVLYYYPIVFLSTIFTILVFNRVEAEIKFNTNNHLSIPRFNFELVQIEKTPKVELNKKDTQTENDIKNLDDEEIDDDLETEMSKSVIFDKSISNEIKCPTYKSHFNQS